MKAEMTRSDLKKIAFQGEYGAYSHLAVTIYFPGAEAIPCPSFEHALSATETGNTDATFLPVENSRRGRVADTHHLLPDSGLKVTGEYFHRVRHQLLGLPNAELSDIRQARSHPQALGQCRNSLAALGITPVPAEDTAGSAKYVSETGDKTIAAVASDLAAQLYGLKILKSGLEDTGNNTTRFFLLEKESAVSAKAECENPVTAFIFITKNIPSALYKALGGFATNGINLLRIESYQLDGGFTSAQFYVEMQCAPHDPLAKNAFRELEFFAEKVKILGVFDFNAQSRAEVIGAE
jgi:prephenate dehydratase